MTMENRYLRAGAGAGGTGLIILELSNGSTLSVFVVPKFWYAETTGAVVNLDDLNGPPRDLTLVIPEFATIRLTSTKAEFLDVCVSKLTGLMFDETSADEDVQGVLPLPNRRWEPLLLEILRPSGFDQFSPIEASFDQLDERIMRFWAGVEEVGASDLISMAAGSDLDAPVLMGRKLIQAIPGLRWALSRLFVAETERALRRRTPDFRERRDVLPFVRGALTRAGRFNASVGDWTHLECEYAELDNDHEWQRLIRSGVRETSNHLRSRAVTRSETELLLRCRRLDIRMADVTPLDGFEARRLRINLSRLGKNRHAIYAARLAAAVLGGSIDLGRKGRNPRDIAIATGLRIPTSQLFERMVAGCLDVRRGLQLVTNREAFALRKGEPARKLPDLLLVDPMNGPHSLNSAIAVVDAKYKMKLPGSMSQMPMSDQYQQFAYAVVSNRPALFLYAAAPGTKSGLIDFGNTSGPQPSQVLGIAAVPFPGPEEVSWSSAIELSMRDTVEAFASLIPDQAESTASDIQPTRASS